MENFKFLFSITPTLWYVPSKTTTFFTSPLILLVLCADGFINLVSSIPANNRLGLFRER